jgi:hypothetical protein
MEKNISFDEEVKIWSKKVYGGTGYVHKTKLISYNSKFSLFKKESSTEYIGRISGSVHGESQWFVLKTFAEGQEMAYDPRTISLFYKEGRLLKSDKELIKKEYELEIPNSKKEIEKHFEKHIILVEKDLFWKSQQAYRTVKYTKAVKEDEKTFTIETLSGEKKTWSKSQYYYKIVDSNIAKEEVEKLNKMIQSYNQKIEEAWKQKEEFLNFFE